MVVNVDVEQTKIIERLTPALSLARTLGQDLLVYLIEVALLESKAAFEPPKVTVVRKG
jgi:hypothetical protein